MPFNLNLDLFSAIEKLIEARQLNQWIKLGIQLTCSFWLSCAFTCGVTLAASRNWAIAVGVGLSTGAVCAGKIWRRSSLTKGMELVLPAKEATAEMDSDLQVISK